MASCIQSPIFLVGSERSGTTLLRLLLDHHPDVAFNLESMFLRSEISDGGSFPDMKKYWGWLAKDRVFQHSHFTVDESLDYKSLMNDFLLQKLFRDGKKYVGATIHYQYRKLKHLWPDAKYVYLLRDGRDVASSVKKIGFSGNDYEACKWWLNAEIEWGKTKKEISDDSWIEVRYEEMTANPTEQLERICAFVGVPYDDNMLKFSKGSSYKEPDPAYNFQWKRKMHQVEVRRIESLIGGRLVQRGYPLSGFPEISISSVRKTVLEIDSRVKKYIFRVKRYGFLLVFGEMITRRFGLRTVQERLSAKINIIIDKNLK